MERDKKKCIEKAKGLRGRNNTNKYEFHHLLHPYYSDYTNQNHYFQIYPSPPLPLPPPLPLLVDFGFRPQNHLQRFPWNHHHHPATSDSHNSTFTYKPATALEVLPKITNSWAAKKGGKRSVMDSKPQSLTVARRPDSGGSEGTVISLLANHFLVQFDPSQRIYHYDLEISPNPSKDIARLIKQKLVEENYTVLSGAIPAYDGRRNLFSPIEFEKDKLELYINLPIPRNNSSMAANLEDNHEKFKLFRVNIKIVSKLEGKKLSNYLGKGGDEWVPIPQDYLQALDVVLRENPVEKCVLLGRSFYPNLTGKDLGGGAIGVQGFYQSLRPTQQGLALNVDLSVTAFHESIGVIAYLKKRIRSLHDLSERKTRGFSSEEKKEAEIVLKNIRVFVCHRETMERYRVHSLTDEPTANLRFRDRDGKNLQIVNYFRDQYNYEIQFRYLPCLQTSRRRPCYLPMELCVICEGQKFLGKLSDDQTAKILELGCRKPRERKTIINGVMAAPFGPSSGNQAEEFNLNISREMTKLKGRILQPPKLKLGDGGDIRDLIPSRHDRQWNLVGSHVFKGTQISRWALVSFGGTGDHKSTIPNFIDRLTRKCEQLGIYLNKKTVISPQFESMQVLSNPSVLESKLNWIQRSASNNLQLLICVMEKKHKGYGDLKRIAETSIGVMSQCCLYQNLAKLSNQFLVNLALKINAKIGGCTMALSSSLPAQVPRVLSLDEPVIFMGADVTHPHPLDDFSPSVAAVVGSVNWPASNKYVSKMRSQTHRQEIIEDLDAMVEEILVDFHRELSKLPTRVIFFRDGVSETQFYKVLNQEVRAIRAACSRFPGYKPRITFTVVQKRHHTRLFPDRPSPPQQTFSDDNVPPGTVVDSVITHPKEFDFYLCSHWGVKGTSRPTHYHILWDENEFTSDELQKLVYNLCFTFVRCTEPVSLVPPCYYAHLAAYRGRLYLDRTDGSSGFTRSGSPKTTPLPKLQERVKNLMFYC
ncbi:hypothetical protein L6452_13125 [Arctium lappa]|uniref:Uncharacterized protein n=1 Tax=Arctium lappa TaxID=4217 RepID=A0ACB9CHD8_ARCLA|nr:hypothetical protein L6452_13125 [Arctium lappa]